jgi:hypothetical protein
MSFDHFFNLQMLRYEQLSFLLPIMTNIIFLYFYSFDKSPLHNLSVFLINFLQNLLTF